MSEILNKVIAEWNETADSDWYMSYRTDEIITEILNNPASAFHPVTWDAMQKAFPEIKGKKICIPSSGDNHAVFAFAALGAEVTSCDICEKQLVYAKNIADKYKLSIDFMVQDTMQLTDMKNSAYDMVYTSNGVHVWINDLKSMYENIHRILKPGGVYINYEIHPFCRPFDYAEGRPEGKEIIVKNPYENTGPFDNGITYHWRLQDILNAVASSGLVIKQLEEMHDEKEKGTFWFYEDKRNVMSQAEIDSYYNWKTNPLAALPQWFTVVAVK